MAGPKVFYDKLMAGSPATVTALETNVSTAMTHVHGAVEDIHLAEGRPVWDSPDARTLYNMRAWATRAVAQVSSMRLNRTELCLRMAADNYREIRLDAEDLWAQWRTLRQPPVTHPNFPQMQAAWTQAFIYLVSRHDNELDQALQFLSAKAPDEEWFITGLVRAMRFDLGTGNDLGPLIPGTALTGDDTGLTPQGLGYDPATGNLVQTSYADGRSVLTIIDPDTGTVINTVDLGPAGSDAPGHAGGVQVDGDSVWVSGGGQMFRYSLADITATTPGGTVPVQGTAAHPDGVVDVEASSFSTIHDGVMYVGRWEANHYRPGELYSYALDESSGRWERSGGPWSIPGETQGISIRDDRIYFSISEGRHFDSTLRSYDFNHLQETGRLGSPLGEERLPPMSEGIVALPDGVHTTYESGSSSYSSPTEVKGAHPYGGVGSLWPGLNMTVTPYGELGGDEIALEPPTLDEASRLFGQAETALDTCDREIARLHLPATSLGDVENAGVFARAVNDHLSTTSRWLDEGRVSAATTRAGLIETARDYEETDNGAAIAATRLAERLQAGYANTTEKVNEHYQRGKDAVVDGYQRGRDAVEGAVDEGVERGRDLIEKLPGLG